MAGLASAALTLLLASPPGLPRAAFVTTPTSVKGSLDAGAPVVGSLSLHAPLLVTACVPTCDDRRGRAVLGDDGVVPLAALGWADGVEPTFVPDSYVWAVARNRDAGLQVLARPKPDAAVLLEEPGLKTLALRAGDERLFERGWLERPAGGFVAASDVWLLKDQSSMRGVEAPALPLVFTSARRRCGRPTAPTPRCPLRSSRAFPSWPCCPTVECWSTAACCRPARCGSPGHSRCPPACPMEGAGST